MSAAHYQVRLEWGAAALTEQAADVIVIADSDSGADARALAALAAPAVVLAAEEGNVIEVAEAVMAEQERRGVRTSVLIVAVGDRWPDGSLRPSTADLLVAGQVVDALAALGIDAHSPACAAACAAAVALRPATASLAVAEATERGWPFAPPTVPGGRA